MTQNNAAAERSAHVTRNEEVTNQDTRPGFWVVLENAEGKVMRGWFTRMEGGIPFGAKTRITKDPPAGWGV